MRKFNRKCEHCSHLFNNGGYEFYEYQCEVFGEDIPDEYVNEDDDGCTCHWKTLEKIIKHQEAKWHPEREYEFCGEWEDLYNCEKYVVYCIKNNIVIDDSIIKKYKDRVAKTEVKDFREARIIRNYIRDFNELISLVDTSNSGVCKEEIEISFEGKNNEK